MEKMFIVCICFLLIATTMFAVSGCKQYSVVENITSPYEGTMVLYGYDNLAKIVNGTVVGKYERDVGYPLGSMPFLDKLYFCSEDEDSILVKSYDVERDLFSTLCTAPILFSREYSNPYSGVFVVEEIKSIFYNTLVGGKKYLCQYDYGNDRATEVSIENTFIGGMRITDEDSFIYYLDEKHSLCELNTTTMEINPLDCGHFYNWVDVLYNHIILNCETEQKYYEYNCETGETKLLLDYSTLSEDYGPPIIVAYDHKAVYTKSIIYKRERNSLFQIGYTDYQRLALSNVEHNICLQKLCSPPCGWNWSQINGGNSYEIHTIKKIPHIVSTADMDAVKRIDSVQIGNKEVTTNLVEGVFNAFILIPNN